MRVLLSAGFLGIVSFLCIYGGVAKHSFIAVLVGIPVGALSLMAVVSAVSGRTRLYLGANGIELQSLLVQRSARWADVAGMELRGMRGGAEQLVLLLNDGRELALGNLWTFGVTAREVLGICRGLRGRSLKDRPVERATPTARAEVERARDRAGLWVGLVFGLVMTALPLYMLWPFLKAFFLGGREGWLFGTLLLVPSAMVIGCGVAVVRNQDEVITGDRLAPSARGLLVWLGVLRGAVLALAGGLRGWSGGGGRFGGGGAAGRW